MIRYSFGGCVYKLEVRAEHATALALLAMAGGREVGLRGIDYTHTSNLPQGRALWLRRAIADTTIDVAVSMDADTWFTDPRAMVIAIERAARDSTIAIWGAPVRRGGTADESNIRDVAGVAYPMEHLPDVDALESIGSVGFGVAIFNVGWFREHWPEPSPEQCSIGTGEDVEMCLAVIRRSGIIACATDVLTRHAEFTP